MISYKCRISNSSGKISEVIKSAPNEQALIKQVNDEKLYLISFSVDKQKRRKWFSKKIILDFTDTMALMLQSGLSVKDALKVASSSFKDKKIGELISTITSALNKGISFPGAIDELDSDFSPLYRGMVKIGDQTGSMEDVFDKLSKYLNDEKKMREKIQGALMYPIMVFSVLFFGILAVFFFIFPKLKQSFFNDTLDVVFARFQLMMFLVLIPSVILVAFIVFLVIASLSKGRMKEIADSIILKIPFIGSISLMRSSLNTMFSLEVLSQSGYPVEAALKESSNVLSNSVLRNAISRIRKAIIRGDRLSAAFDREKAFPDRIAVWIGVGEASGDVSKVFSQLRSYFQGELDKLTSRIMLMIEPVLIVFVGAFMITFVILFVVPLFSIFGSVL